MSIPLCHLRPPHHKWILTKGICTEEIKNNGLIDVYKGGDLPFWWCFSSYLALLWASHTVCSILCSTERLSEARINRRKRLGKKVVLPLKTLLILSGSVPHAPFSLRFAWGLVFGQFTLSGFGELWGEKRWLSKPWILHSAPIFLYCRCWIGRCCANYALGVLWRSSLGNVDIHYMPPTADKIKEPILASILHTSDLFCIWEYCCEGKFCSYAIPEYCNPHRSPPVLIFTTSASWY